MPAQDNNSRRRLVRTTTLVWILLLFAAAPRVYGGTVLVLYPDAPPPYQQAFEQMIEGLKRSVSQSLETLPLPGNYDIPTIERWIDAHKKGDTTLVLLGQRALDAYAQLSIRLPVFVGGVSRLDDKTELPGISLTIATPVVLAAVHELLPSTQTLIVFYNPTFPGWVPPASPTTAVRGLTIRPIAVTDAQTAVKEISRIVETVDPQTTALWFMEGTISLNTELILPFVLEETWKRRIPAFSDAPSYVKRGLLFALYPDYDGVGVELGFRLQPGAPGPLHGMAFTHAARFAINTRTAQHLGIPLRTELIERADAVFPAP